jgi:hypothetical protein
MPEKPMLIGVGGEILEVPISPPLHRKSPVAEKLRGFFVCAKNCQGF